MVIQFHSEDLRPIEELYIINDHFNNARCHLGKMQGVNILVVLFFEHFHCFAKKILMCQFPKSSICSLNTTHCFLSVVTKAPFTSKGREEGGTNQLVHAFYHVNQGFPTVAGLPLKPMFTCLPHTSVTYRSPNSSRAPLHFPSSHS